GEFRELHQAYYFMMRLRLTHQTQQILSHQAPDNLVPVDEMSKIEQVTLKEIFKVVEKYQRRLSVVFMGMLTY
ncbi:MAG: putative nucleotidyltransferase substrate binding domain-containing protein, partial [Bacteroidota bacterium]